VYKVSDAHSRGEPYLALKFLCRVALAYGMIRRAQLRSGLAIWGRIMTLSCPRSRSLLNLISTNLILPVHCYIRWVSGINWLWRLCFVYASRRLQKRSSEYFLDPKVNYGTTKGRRTEEANHPPLC
jgi:hypothetical protein